MSRAAQDVAERLGFGYLPTGGAQLRAEFAHLPEVPRRAQLRHVISGVVDGRAVLLFQSSYLIFTGQTTVQVAYTLYVTDAPPWPATHVTPRGPFERLFYRLGHRPGLPLDDPEFNRRFKVRTDDDDFAIALLSPEMQRFMLDKATVRWRVGSGRVCLVYRGTLKAARLDASLDRLKQFWTLVAPELLAW